MTDCMAVILAGGKGSRLDPLTRDRAKPAVPFGASFRIVDFVLSNCLNSGLRKLLVLTQYKAMSLDRHINRAWSKYYCRELGEFLDVVPPQHRIDEHWYAGTADAVYQNIFALEQERPEHIVVLAGDHIYKMNYRHMIDYHRDTAADLTIGALQVTRDAARQFGVLQVDGDQCVVGFSEKPNEPQPISGSDDTCLISMGIYVFGARFLYEQLCRDALTQGSSHDFGRDVIPSLIDGYQVRVFPFRDENRKQQAYWRDVGSIDAYYEANMDLVAVDPLLNLYDQDWPIRTHRPNLPPAKFVFSGASDQTGCGRALDSMVGLGSVISGGFVERSVVGNNVRVDGHAHVESSILFDGVHVGREATIRRAILDDGVEIPPGMQIGCDVHTDREKGLTVTDSGIVVVRHGMLEHRAPHQDNEKMAAPSTVISEQ